MTKNTEKELALLNFVNTPIGRYWSRIANGARYFCIAVWIILPVAFVVFYFVEGFIPIGRVIISVFLVLASIAVYIRLTRDLRVIAHSKSSEEGENE